MQDRNDRFIVRSCLGFFCLQKNEGGQELNLLYLSIALAAILFWAFYRAINPPESKYAAKDFLTQEKRGEAEERIVRQSVIHQLIYPIYYRVQQWRPMGKHQYDAIQQELIKAGEYEARPEDIQMAQITNATMYPLFFLLISMIIGGDYQVYIVFFGFAAGIYMYRAPMSNLQSKQKKHNEHLLQDFTRFVTVYLMQVSGNSIPHDALLAAVEKTKKKCKALSYYLVELENDLDTKGTEKALKEFSMKLNRSYVDRFTNNVQLMIKQAGGDQTTLNVRLREALTEMQERLADEKIQSMKAQARIPTFASVGVIAIYMIIMLGASMMMIL